MIPINVLSVRIPGQPLDALLESEAWVCPGRIDTVTPVTQPKQHQCPPGAKAVIRYLCPVNGFRLYFVAEDARTVARMRMRALQGEDPTSPDFGGDMPDGI